MLKGHFFMILQALNNTNITTYQINYEEKTSFVAFTGNSNGIICTRKRSWIRRSMKPLEMQQVGL